ERHESECQVLVRRKIDAGVNERQAAIQYRHCPQLQALILRGATRGPCSAPVRTEKTAKPIGERKPSPQLTCGQSMAANKERRLPLDNSNPEKKHDCIAQEQLPESSAAPQYFPSLPERRFYRHRCRAASFALHLPPQARFSQRKPRQQPEREAG